MQETDRQEHWHVSKSINVGVLLGFVANVIAVVWVFSSMNSDIDRNKIELVRLDTRVTSVEKIVQEQAVTMARMDANIQAIREYIEQMIKQRLNN